jgi:hypothetical protein
MTITQPSTVLCVCVCGGGCNNKGGVSAYVGV